MLERVALGEEIIIKKAGIPVAKLAPVYAQQGKRPLAMFRGEIWMADDFDGPLPDDILAGEDPPNQQSRKQTERKKKKTKERKK